jgi:putative phage-type endonuclease
MIHTQHTNYTQDALEKIELEQGSQQWLDLRRTKITSTDACIIVESNPFRSISQLYIDKIEGRQQEMTEPMRRGIELEPFARDAFCVENCLDMSPGVFVRGFAMASLDGITKDQKIAVEIKCPGERNHMLASLGQVPPIYYPQLQHIMYVVGLDSIYYYSFDGYDGINIIVHRDNDFIEKMVEKEIEFYNLLISKTPPQEKHKERNDDLWKHVAARYKLISQQRKELEKEEEELKTQLISMSDNVNCKGSGVCVSSYKRKGSVQYDKIPELKNIDIERYRSEEKTMYRVTLEN